MQQGLSLRVSQHLTLTPQLQQSIRLLQLSTQELEQEVEQMLNDNPFLERELPAAEREAFGVAQADTPVNDFDRAVEAGYWGSSASHSAAGSSSRSDGDDVESSPEDGPNWDGDGTLSMSFDDAEWGSEAHPSSQSKHEDEVDAATLARSQESLADFLQRQALALRLGAEDAAALSFLIGSLNDDGYLEDTLADLARALGGNEDVGQLEQLQHHLTVALGLLQSLEPVGVGARNLAECLSLQLQALLRHAAVKPWLPDVSVMQTALAICAQPMVLLARRDIKKLATLCCASSDLVRAAIALIGRLEPKPGRRFVDVERNIVVPDVLVTKVSSPHGSHFAVHLNPDVVPKLQVHDIYANALKGYKPTANQDASALALQKRLQEARWFIKSIRQRFDTILRVSTAIVERQKNFFLHGEMAMRPMVLREVADELGLHESTVSRVTNAKYIATPYGTFELKYFFGSGLGTGSGSNASSTAVRALIKQFIGAENSKKPLSDGQLSDLLQQHGIVCARRTVAKYREGLRLAPASLRKAL